MSITWRLPAIVAAPLFVVACGGEPATSTTADNTLSTNAVPAAPVTPATANQAMSADAIALGMTEPQLLDADFKDWNGGDLGDVEAIERDGGGTVTHVVVEIDDTNPDRFVRVPLDGLERVADGDDWDVRGQFTRDQLMALPEVPAQPGW